MAERPCNACFTLICKIVKIVCLSEPVGDFVGNVRFFNNTTAESFNIKKLSNRLIINKKISFNHKNCYVAFLSHHLGDLGVTYMLNLYLIGNHISTFYMIIEHF